MKRLFNYLLLFTLTTLLFTACSKDDDGPDLPVSDDISGFYFFNYGGSGAATITKYAYENDSVINNYYEAQNGIELNSNVQYACEYNDKIYMMGNGVDQVIVLGTDFVQSIDGITENIHTPRYCVGSGNYLYVSCLGANPDWNVMPDSYIAVLNVTTNTVESTIALPGGPEGLAVANGNLYAALNYKDSVAVISLNDNSVSYIETPAVTSYFVKDNNNNLYVSLVSTYSDYSSTTGLGYINTTNNTLDATYALDGVSSGYSAILAPDADLSTIYVLASSWVEQASGSWIQQGAIYAFNTASKEFTPLIENLIGTNGMFVDPRNDEDKIYVFGAESYSEPGTVDIYTTDGTYVSQFDCGISPYWAIFLQKD